MKLEEFYHLKSPPDGGCFFHSLAIIFEIENFNTIEKVRKTNGKPFVLMKESNELRKRVVDWLSENMDYRIKGIGLRLEDELKEEIDNEIAVAEDNDRDPKYESTEDYLKFMSDNSAYSGQFEIYAISELFGRNVRVFTEKPPKSGNLHNFGLGYELNNNKNDIFLFHNLSNKKDATQHHFEPLILKSTIVKDSDKAISVKKKASPKPAKRTTRRKAEPKRTSSRRVDRRRTSSRRVDSRRTSSRRVDRRRTSRRRVDRRRTTRRVDRRRTSSRRVDRRRTSRRNTRKTQKRK